MLIFTHLLSWTAKRTPNFPRPLTRNNPINPSVEQVTEYLSTHPEFLERYVMEQVDVEQLERWIIRKSQRLKKKSGAAKNGGRKTSLSRWKFCVHADKRQMLQDLTHSLQLRPTKDHVLWELANCISSAVGADGFRSVHWFVAWSYLTGFTSCMSYAAWRVVTCYIVYTAAINHFKRDLSQQR